MAIYQTTFCPVPTDRSEVQGSITVRLTRLFCLDSAILIMFNLRQLYLFGEIQTSQTGVTETLRPMVSALCTDQCPNEVFNRSSFSRPLNSGLGDLGEEHKEDVVQIPAPDTRLNIF